MKRQRWLDTPVHERIAAVRAAGTALVGELVGWEPQSLRLGLCRFFGSAAEPWQEACATAAGDSATAWFFGDTAGASKPSKSAAPPSKYPTPEAGRWLGSAGLTELAKALRPVFDSGSIGRAVLPVAKFLVEEDSPLFRGCFLHLAWVAFDSSRTMRTAQAMCRRVSADVIDKHRRTR